MSPDPKHPIIYEPAAKMIHIECRIVRPPMGDISAIALFYDADRNLQVATGATTAEAIDDLLDQLERAGLYERPECEPARIYPTKCGLCRIQLSGPIFACVHKKCPVQRVPA